MSAALACGLLLPTVSAALAIRALWPRALALPAALLAALALGLGAALAACTFWLALLVGGGNRALLIGLDLAVLMISGLVWHRVRMADGVGAGLSSGRFGGPPTEIRDRGGDTPAPGHSELALFGVVAVAAVAAVTAFVLNAAAQPHGEWDAWAIWNLRARFLFRAGAAWRQAFAAELMHADYPPLLPAAVAHAWTWAGGDPASAPIALAAMFALALALLLGAALALLRGRTLALLGSACLLGTPILLQRAAWQYADTPLAFFLLATVALLAIADRSGPPAAPGGVLVLAGAAAGCAALTKNEGVLFVLAIGLARGIPAVRAGAVDWRRAGSFGAGLALPLLLLAHFKLGLAPPSYLVADQEAGAWLARLADPSRYRAVAAAFGAEAIRALGPLVVALPAAALLLGLTRDAGARRAGGWIGATVMVIALGYGVVYLLTPLDLAWQLSHSADRLVLHLWPAALFAVLLALARPRRTAGARGGHERLRVVG